MRRHVSVICMFRVKHGSVTRFSFRFAKLRARVCMHTSVSAASLHAYLPQRLLLPLPHMRLMPRLTYALPSPTQSPWPNSFWSAASAVQRVSNRRRRHALH
jgi:hypothetical protein